MESKRTRTARIELPIEPPVSQQYLDRTSPGQTDQLLLRAWNFPTPILQYYLDKGISRFFPWQVECLTQPGILSQQRNLLYSAPTSAGKSMVADVLLFKTLLETSRKALIVLPFVSITVEKVNSLKEVLRALRLRIDSFAGQSNPKGGFDRVDVAVCTIEKANHIVNRLLEEKRLTELGLVIVDELHMVGDPSRGYLLELLLSKLMHRQQHVNITNNSMAASLPTSPPARKAMLQIVGMSATLPNLHQVAQWLNAELYVTEYRPVPLYQHLVSGRQVFGQQGQKVRLLELDDFDFTGNADQANLVYLSLETVQEGYSTLIFCATKQSTEGIARLIANNIYRIGRSGRGQVASLSSSSSLTLSSQKMSQLSQGLVSQLDFSRIVALLDALRRSGAGLDPQLETVCRFGVAFHHAGLSMDERGILEQAFRDGTIRILCCTTTLSAGVNLPARRVLITSPYDYRQQLWPVATYRQMIGRAGRKGIDTLGESYLFCHSPLELSKIQTTLVEAEPLPVESHLISQTKDDKNEIVESVERAVLESLVTGSAETEEGVKRFFNCTLYGTLVNTGSSEMAQVASTDQSKARNLTQMIARVVEHLERQFFVIKRNDDDEDKSLAVTPLGRAVVASGLMPTSSKFLVRELGRARATLCLLSDLHLVYEVTPPQVSEQLEHSLDWRHYLTLWSKLKPEAQHVATLVGVRESYLVAHIATLRTCSDEKEAEDLRIHRRFYVSLALYDLVCEMSLGSVSVKYRLSRGLVQSLQQQAATFAGQLSTFATRLGWQSLALLIEQFQPRLTFGVQHDLIDLMRITCLTAPCARALHTRGWQTVLALIYLKPSEIEPPLVLVATSAGKAESQDPTTLQLFIPTLDRHITVRHLCRLIIDEARALVEVEVGQELQFDNPDLDTNQEDQEVLSQQPRSPLTKPTNDDNEDQLMPSQPNSLDGNDDVSLRQSRATQDDQILLSQL